MRIMLTQVSSPSLALIVKSKTRQSILGPDSLIKESGENAEKRAKREMREC